MEEGYRVQLTSKLNYHNSLFFHCKNLHRAQINPLLSFSRSETALDEQNKELSDLEVSMNFPRDQIKLGKEIGEGDFGKVIQAEAKKLLPGQKKTSVVVKQLKEGATKEERDVFLRPVEAMK